MKRKPEVIDRRNLFFSSAALAAGALLLDESTAAADNPAANVVDRLTSLKITGLKATRVGTKAYFKIETNHKVTGWGEVTGLDPKVSCALAESLFELLDGENPTRDRAPLAKACTARIATCAAARSWSTRSPAIDMALWDITGKLLGRAGLPPAGRPTSRQDPHVSDAEGPQDRHRRSAPLVSRQSDDIQRLVDAGRGHAQTRRA